VIKAVLFDYGGTLFQSVKPWEEMKPQALLAAYRYLKRHRLKMPYDEYLVTSTKLFDRYVKLEDAKQRDIPDRLKYLDLVNELFPAAARKEKLALAAGANDSFWRVANSNYKPRRGAKACIGELQSMGLKLGIVSNHHDEPSLKRSLRRYGMESKFYPIVASEAARVRKPDPAIFRLCLSAIGANPKEAIYVGDSPTHDVAGARATGMLAVLIGTRLEDGPEPDFTVERLAAIPHIVQRLNGNK